MAHPETSEDVRIASGRVLLEGTIELPRHPKGVVVFAHGSGSSRWSPRNGFVARLLREAGLGTLLLDLLTPEEEEDFPTRFDIDLLTERLSDAVRYTERRFAPDEPPAVGLFGASTGAAAALRTAALMPDSVKAVVSRGGRPDLAGDEALKRVCAPTLLIVGGHDDEVIELNREAYRMLGCAKELAIVPGATHLFEEPGALQQVAKLAAAWFQRHLHDAEGLPIKSNRLNEETP